MTDFPVFVGDKKTLKDWSPKLEGLTTDGTLITNLSSVTPTDSDYLLISDTSDSGNLKKATAEDVANLFKEDIASWTPTVTASGSMTVSSVTINHAEYEEGNNTVDINFSFDATLGGTVSNQIYITTPLTISTDWAMSGTALIQTGGAWGMGAIYGDHTSSAIRVFKSDLSSYSSGALKMRGTAKLKLA